MTQAADGLLPRLLRAPARRPLSTLAALLLLAVAGGAGVAWRGVRTELGVEQLVARGDPVFARYEALNAAFGRDDNNAFVFAVREGGGWFTPEGARHLLALSEALAGSPLVEEVVGPATATLIHDEGEAVYVGSILTAARVESLGPAGLARVEAHLRRERAYADRVLSRDGTTAAFTVRIAPEYVGGAHHAAVVAHVEQALAAQARPGVRFLVTGGPITQHAYREFIRRETGGYVLATLALLAVALAVTLRSLAGVLLPLGAVGLALYFTAVFLALAGIPLNLLASAIPVLVLIVGISDAIHLLTRYGEELATGRGRAPALERALSATARACLLTSITTSAGFFALPATGIPMLADLGLVTGAGVLIAYLVTLTLLPAVLALLPPPRRAPSSGEDARLAALGRRVMTRPLAVALALAAALGVLLALGAPRLRVESRVVDDLPRDHPIVRTREEVDARMGGNYPLTLMIHAAAPGVDPSRDPELLAGVAALQDALARLPGTPVYASSLAFTDYVGLIWRELGGEGLPPTREALEQVELLLSPELREETVEPGGGALRVQLRVYDRGTAATFAFLEQARAAFEEALGGRATLEVQGFTYLAHRTHREVVASSLSGFSLDFAIVAALVALLFRSVRLTALALVPNLFPLACTLAFMGLAGIELKIASAVVFSIVFGIAVDDTVHFLARYHEERTAGLPPRAAVERTLGTTGRAMLFMAIVLAAGFAALLGSAFTPNRVLGLLMAVTVASGVLGDLVLLPALLALGDPAPGERP